jgi:hypothetical protein
VFTGHILETLTGNQHFPEPQPSLAELSSLKARYDSALAKAKSRSREDVLAKDLAKADLKKGIRELFNYVVDTGKNDIQILTSSGFPLAKSRHPVGDMPKPKNFRVVQGDGSGEVHLSLKKEHGASSYIYQYLPTPSPEVENWHTIVSPSTRLTINNLTAGTKYMFRVSAVGAKGQGPWSDFITRFVS